MRGLFGTERESKVEASRGMGTFELSFAILIRSGWRLLEDMQGDRRGLNDQTIDGIF